MAEKTLLDSLIVWLRTFDVTIKVEGIEDLTDGLFIGECLNRIDSKHFDSDWLSKLKPDTLSDWRLKVSNLKKIVERIVDFYNDVLHQALCFRLPNVIEIGQNVNRKELTRLLQLLLGCAVNCDRKEEYIQQIMKLGEHVQAAIMTAIQELMDREESSSPAAASSSEDLAALEKELSKLRKELQKSQEEKVLLESRCFQLNAQMTSFVEERQVVDAEHEKLKEQLKNDVPEEASSAASKKIAQLQQTIDQLQEDLYKTENVKEEYKSRIEGLTESNQEMQEKMKRLSEASSENQMLKDEIDEMKHSLEKAMQYETTIETYRKKMEEMADLRKQVKMLEEKNTEYVANAVEKESELRKISNTKQQLELYKQQVQELQLRADEQLRRADKAEFEKSRGEERLHALTMEHERVVAERRSLKDKVEELTAPKVREGLEMMGDPSSDINLLEVPLELREKVLRLQMENKALKQKAHGDGNPLIEAQFDDARKRIAQLEGELRDANKKIISLEADEGISIGAPVYRGQTREDALNRLQERVHCLEEQLAQKCEQVTSIEEKYTKYMYKAKMIINRLSGDRTRPADVDELRRRLIEKQQDYEALQKDHEKYREGRETEDKLISSAWYNLSMQLHRNSTEERLGESHLSKQRRLRLEGDAEDIAGH